MSVLVKVAPPSVLRQTAIARRAAGTDGPENSSGPLRPGSCRTLPWTTGTSFRVGSTVYGRSRDRPPSGEWLSRRLPGLVPCWSLALKYTRPSGSWAAVDSLALWVPSYESSTKPGRQVLPPSSLSSAWAP
ncbi:hypothetical protein GCM10010256_05730 [Streptomyces coeruleorubidus]|nr:hypothetical protein GCM10010256_05730 [Streptomyces coeruleorubidus]